MSKLPRITPTCTPRSVSAAASYGPYPPPELTSTWNQMKFPPKINPLAPPPPRKRLYASWETTPQHWHNDRRRLMMQQKEHERYHSAWSTPFYGPPADKEAYRRHYRQVLKQQMSDADEKKRTDLQSKVHESEAAVEFDRQCKMKDFQDIVKKYNYLKNFRDDNKMFMEESWEKSRINKIMTDRYDREMLKYNPINWSGTLS
ncbi:uncharacterized protein LOC131937565 [Physella acuta]|uniref:uncharacterized protein LOC131937565 n=1 Tax=Physella acuta TaxID=109671 RepID=UPI0027DBA943|nr:uncharacterized protein LOC131937565 [Physella acuta]XP_059151081.1 uncharacterized protein LOC131937565 [Physella acuta]